LIEKKGPKTAFLALKTAARINKSKALSRVEGDLSKTAMHSFSARSFD
jgi:hypothetical protein